MSLNTTPGDPAADSYFAIAYADTYFANRGVATWTGTLGAKESAARRGTTYLDNQYRARWVGLRTNQLQSLQWPRCDGMRGYYRGYTQLLLDIDGFTIDQNSIPAQVMNAACEAALLAITGVSLEPQLVRGGMIKSLQTKVDVLEKTIVYQDGAPAMDRYTVIEGLLRGLVLSTPGAPSGTVQLLRS